MAFRVKAYQTVLIKLQFVLQIALFSKSILNILFFKNSV